MKFMLLFLLATFSGVGQAATKNNYYTLPLWEVPSLEEMAKLVEGNRGKSGKQLIAQNNTKNDIILGVGRFTHRISPGKKESISLSGSNQLLSVSVEVNPKFCKLVESDLDLQNCLQLVHYGYYKLPLPIAFNINIYNEMQISTGSPEVKVPWSRFSLKHFIRDLKNTYKPKISSNFYWNIDRAYQDSAGDWDLIHKRLSENPLSDWEIGSYFIDEPNRTLRVQSAPFNPIKTAYGKNNFSYFSVRQSFKQKLPIIFRNNTAEDMSLVVESVYTGQYDFVKIIKNSSLELFLPPHERSIVQILKPANHDSCGYDIGKCWDVLYTETHRHPTFFSLEKTDADELVFHYSEGSL